MATLNITPSSRKRTGRSYIFTRRHIDETPVTQALDESQVDVDDDDKVAAELEAPYGTQLWNDLDAEGCDDPVKVSEYIADICVYFKEIELRVSPIIA